MAEPPAARRVRAADRRQPAQAPLLGVQAAGAPRPEEFRVELDGDGAGGLVEAWGSRDPGDGRVAVALWNVALDQTRSTGESLLDRSVRLRIGG